MAWLNGRGYYDDEPEEPTAHIHINDNEDRGVCDVVASTAAIPASLAELRSWYGVQSVTIKGPCYGGRGCW